jgi:hypothetical protein
MISVNVVRKKACQSINLLPLRAKRERWAGNLKKITTEISRL